jgi:hypothetical protein
MNQAQAMSRKRLGGLGSGVDALLRLKSFQVNLPLHKVKNRTIGGNLKCILANPESKFSLAEESSFPLLQVLPRYPDYPVMIRGYRAWIFFHRQGILPDRLWHIKTT